jgi:hypothetical protein
MFRMAGPDMITDAASSKTATATATRAPPKNEIPWPLAYALQPVKQTSSLQACSIRTDQPVVAQKPWWSHTLYRGPANKAVEVLYSKTRDRSETLAQMFISESVIGFDMVMFIIISSILVLTLYLSFSGVAPVQGKESQAARKDRTYTDRDAREGGLVPYRPTSREDYSRDHRTVIAKDN